MNTAHQKPDALKPKSVAADQAVRSVAEDRLGRAAFAEALADAILGWSEPESLVVALTGPWGVGKSSITNFVVEKLRATRGDARPDVLLFNPWLVAGQGDVASRLLSDIGVALNRVDRAATNKALARKWKRWAAALSLGSSVTSAYPNIPLSLIAAGVLAVGGGNLVASGTLTTWLDIIGVTAAAAGVTLAASATIAEKAEAFFTTRAESSEQTLDDLKAELKVEMAKHPRQLVVVVDDIDRLPAQEIQLLLRAVRANADFPNLVFLLVFERDVVEQAIKDQAHVDGGEYLKKIIQIPFTVPTVESARLRTILFTGLDAVLDTIPQTVPFDTQRWGNLFFSGLHAYFRTLRDVYRYTTTVEFHVAMFRSEGAMEVNQIDLLALEALRVFEPRLYAALPAHRRLLLRGAKRGGDRENKEEALAELSALLQLAEPSTRDAARAVLASVFQPIGWLVANSGFGYGFEEGWARSLRACSETFFDRYFHLAIPAGEISESELQAILASAGSRAELVSRFESLRQRDLLPAVLERLEAYKEKIDLRFAVPFVTALFDIGDGLPRSNGMFSLGADMHAARIVFWYLKRFATMPEREAALLEALRATTGLDLPTHVVAMERRREDSQKSDYLISEERLPEFNALCADKIAAAATSGRLSEQPNLGSLLYRWKEWGDEAAVRGWVAKVVAEPEGALRIVAAFTGDVRSQGIGDYVSTVRKVTHLKDVETFIPAEELDIRLSALDRAALPASDAAILRAFDRTMQRRREGKPDRGPLDLDDDDDD